MRPFSRIGVITALAAWLVCGLGAWAVPLLTPGDFVIAIDLDSWGSKYRTAEGPAVRAAFEANLVEAFPDATIHGQPAPRLPNTTLVSFPNLEGEALPVGNGRDLDVVTIGDRVIAMSSYGTDITVAGQNFTATRFGATLPASSMDTLTTRP